MVQRATCGPRGLSLSLSSLSWLTASCWQTALMKLHSGEISFTEEGCGEYKMQLYRFLMSGSDFHVKGNQVPLACA